MVADPTDPITDLDTLLASENAKPVNKQVYANSSLSNSSVESVQKAQDAAGQGLHGSRPPNLAIQHEKAEHRIVLLLTLKGLNNREIAKQMDYTEAWVSQIKRQPWFQVRLIEELSKAQEDVLDQILKVEATNSVFTLIHLRDHAKNEGVRADCAKDILNRHLGKPAQKIEHTGEIGVAHSVSRVENINEELLQIEAEEARLLGGAR